MLSFKLSMLRIRLFKPFFCTNLHVAFVCMIYGVVSIICIYVFYTMFQHVICSSFLVHCVSRFIYYHLIRIVELDNLQFLTDRHKRGLFEALEKVKAGRPLLQSQLHCFLLGENFPCFLT